MDLLGFIVVIVLLLVIYMKLDSNVPNIDKRELSGENDPLRKRYNSHEHDKRI